MTVHGTPEEDGGIAHVAPELNHLSRSKFFDEADNDIAFGMADIGEPRLLAEFFNEIQDFVGMTADLIDIGLSKNKVQEFHFAALFALVLIIRQSIC